MIILECQGSLVLAKQDDSGFIPGAWGLPVRQLKSVIRPISVARAAVRAMIGSVPRLDGGEAVEHAITYRKILAHVFRGQVSAPAPDLAGSGLYAWFEISEARRLLTSSLFRKALVQSKIGVGVGIGIGIEKKTVG